VIPVEHRAELAELALEVGDVARHQAAGVLADPRGVLLGVEPEGVEAHRLEDRVATPAPPAPVHVGAGVGVDVADVQPLGGGVGEHHQVVEVPLGALQRGGVAARGRPVPPPSGLDRTVVIAADIGG
jgi:hypothetical protein